MIDGSSYPVDVLGTTLFAIHEADVALCDPLFQELHHDLDESEVLMMGRRCQHQLDGFPRLPEETKRLPLAVQRLLRLLKCRLLYNRHNLCTSAKHLLVEKRARGARQRHGIDQRAKRHRKPRSKRPASKVVRPVVVETRPATA